MSLDTYVKRDTDLNMNLQSPSFQNEPLCKQEKRVGKVHLRRRKLFSVSDVCAALEGSCTLPPSDTGTRKSLPPSDPRTKTRPNWARKVREMIMFSVLCTVYYGRGCVSLESEYGKELA